MERGIDSPGIALTPIRCSSNVRNVLGNRMRNHFPGVELAELSAHSSMSGINGGVRLITGIPLDCALVTI
jgi:hypothetical protein